MEILDHAKKEKRMEEICKTMTDNFPTLISDIKQIQEANRTP
jgi:hypothetical protein